MRPGPFDRATVIYSTVWHPSIIEVVPKSSTDFPRKLRSRDRIRSPMVGKACARIRRSPSCPPLGRHDIDHRCLKIWLGSNIQGKQYCGYLDSGREESPHKLKAVLLPLQTFVSTRQNIHILLLLDNSSAIAHKAFRVLSNLALEIWEWCLTRWITIHVECITLWQMQSRDEPSDWKVHKKVFDQLQKIWGPHNVVLFATSNCLVFSASNPTRKRRQWMPWRSAGQIWKLMLFPPFALIGRCLQKLEQVQVKELQCATTKHGSDQAHRPADLGTPIDSGRLRSFMSSIQTRKGTGKSYSSAWGKWQFIIYHSVVHPIPGGIWELGGCLLNIPCNVTQLVSHQCGEKWLKEGSILFRSKSLKQAR